MDHASEALMRSALHDLANCLSGIRGILELSLTASRSRGRTGATSSTSS
jgi:hypothetical protein